MSIASLQETDGTGGTCRTDGEQRERRELRTGAVSRRPATSCRNGADVTKREHWASFIPLRQSPQPSRAQFPRERRPLLQAPTSVSASTPTRRHSAAGPTGSDSHGCPTRWPAHLSKAHQGSAPDPREPGYRQSPATRRTVKAAHSALHVASTLTTPTKHPPPEVSSTRQAGASHRAGDVRRVGIRAEQGSAGSPARSRRDSPGPRRR